MKKDNFWKRLREVHQTRDEYYKTKKAFDKLFEKTEKCCEKLELLEKKNSLWSSICYLFLYRRVLKLWNEVKIEKAILDMRLDKWQMELDRL